MTAGMLLLGTTWGYAGSPYNDSVLSSKPAYYWTFDEEGVVNAVEQVSQLADDELVPGENSVKGAVHDERRWHESG